MGRSYTNYIARRGGGGEAFAKAGDNSLDMKGSLDCGGAGLSLMHTIPHPLGSRTSLLSLALLHFPFIA